MNGRD
jgi:hypothetical protein